MIYKYTTERLIANIPVSKVLLQLGACITRYKETWYGAEYYSDWGKNKSEFVLTKETPYLTTGTIDDVSMVRI